MDSGLVAPLLSGGFALLGGVVGASLTSWLNRRNERLRLAAEDERRWLNDRRRLYATYLTLVEAALREIDAVGVFLPYSDEGERIDQEDEGIIQEGLFEYFRKWEEVLQPALLEVQLMASPEVEDLANRMSGALMEITSPVELRRSFTEYYPGWFQALDMATVLRNAMRIELGLPSGAASPFVRNLGWPWLEDRPSRESYIQSHSAEPEQDNRNQGIPETELRERTERVRRHTAGLLGSRRKGRK